VVEVPVLPVDDVPVVVVLLPLMLAPPPLVVRLPPLLVVPVPVEVNPLRSLEPVVVVEVPPVVVVVPVPCEWTFPYCPHAVPTSAKTETTTNHRFGAGPFTVFAGSSV
jgi:hypothetical protein